MIAFCPACGRENDAEGMEPGTLLTCSRCGQTFQYNPPPAEELGISEQEEPPTPIADAAPSEAAEEAVLCPICKSKNPAESKVCKRCGAELRRKHWEETADVAGHTATLPIRRRPLTLLLLFAVAVGLVGGVIWMAGRLLVAVETPTLAYTRMAGMAAHGEWGRFYDRIHPKTQQHLTAMAQGERGSVRTARELFMTKDFGTGFMAISDLPYKDFSITKEEFHGDRALLDIKKADGGHALVWMGKDQGIWKLCMPELEGPEK